MGDPSVPTAAHPDVGVTIPDPYSPLPAPPTGAPASLPQEEEPIATGTFFLMIVFLMLIAGFWAVVYLTLLRR